MYKDDFIDQNATFDYNGELCKNMDDCQRESI
jgi:hypothetical protein